MASRRPGGGGGGGDDGGGGSSSRHTLRRRSPAEVAREIEALPQPRLTCNFVREMLYLNILIVGVMLTMLWDFVSCNRIIKWERIDAQWLSTRLGRRVMAVTFNKRMMERSCEDVGAGGTGTSRAWLTCMYEDGTEHKLFAKKPAATFSERLFLSAFQVYRNEYNFYKSVAPGRRFSEDSEVAAMFARPMVTWWKGQNFMLIMDDLANKGAEFVAISEPYPLTKVTSVMRSFARLHAHFWERPPANVWTDEWSCKLTVPPTKGRTRPRFLHLIAQATLRRFLARYGPIISSELLTGYDCLIKNFAAVRAYWSRPPLTLAHGDGHLGNMWFTKNGDECGFFDMQCNAAEHCMRDVTYNLLSGCDTMQLRDHEESYIRLYLDFLNANLARRGIAPLSFEEAWEQYRIQSWWCLAAFLISAGANDLMETSIGRLTLLRITKAMERINALEALLDVVAAAHGRR